MSTELLSELIRVRSVNPPGDGEGDVAEMLRDRLDGAGLETSIHRSPSGRPSLVARLPGPTERPALVLVSHTDVVPVEEDSWSRDPFGGEIADGHIWGRGALDMKGVAVMHVEAVMALASSRATPDREVIVVAVADEEEGGGEGAAWLLDAHPGEVGFRNGAPPPAALGEGAFGLAGVLSRPVMPIVVGEKGPLGVRATASGDAGHGSMPPARQPLRELTAFVEEVSGPRGTRLHPVMRETFRAFAGVASGPQAAIFRLLSDGRAAGVALRVVAPLLRARSGAIGHLLDDTITPTMVEAGVKFNVCPGSATATFDCRLLPDTDPDEVLADLRAAGRRRGIEVEELHRWSSPTSPRGPLFDLLEQVSAELPSAPVVAPSLTPGMTDLRYFRARGASGYGWVPAVLSPEVVRTFHGHDERIPVEQFETAVSAMTDLVHRAAT